MREYLKNKIGEKLGVIRAGFPKEVYFEARLKALENEVAVFETEEGEEFALCLDKIIIVGPPEKSEEQKPPAGFFSREK